jgi:DNA-binding Lrp family transcriptional regulator
MVIQLKSGAVSGKFWRIALGVSTKYENTIGKLPKECGVMEIDPIDQQLLSLLRENARLSTTELARRLDLSRTTVQSRIERLERQKIITGYTVKAGGADERSYIKAHVMITAVPKLTPSVEAALRQLPQVRTLHSVSGVYDFIAVLAAPTVGELDLLIDGIGALEGVERTTTSIVLSTRIDR